MEVPSYTQVASDGLQPYVRHYPASCLHPLCHRLLDNWPLLLQHLAQDAGAVYWVKMFNCVQKAADMKKGENIQLFVC